jgi:hypothetical protein
MYLSAISQTCAELSQYCFTQASIDHALYVCVIVLLLESVPVANVVNLLIASQLELYNCNYLNFFSHSLCQSPVK